MSVSESENTHSVFYGLSNILFLLLIRQGRPQKQDFRFEISIEKYTNESNKKNSRTLLN